MIVLAFAGCGDPKPVNLDSSVLDSYVGQYQADANTVISVSRNGDHLEIQVNQQPPIQTRAQSENEFLLYHGDTPTPLTFVKDETGEVTHLVLHRNGEHSAHRIGSQPSDGEIESVDINGTEIRFLSIGEGPFTIILEGGIGGWGAVQRELSSIGHVICCERAGTVTARQIADNLHLTLQRIEVSPPYLLVGHSFGGAVVRVFASMFPEEVSGLVLVDPFQEGFLDWLRIHQPQNFENFVKVGRENYCSDWDASVEQIRAARPLPEIPIVLLSAGNRQQRKDNAFESSIEASGFGEGSRAIMNAHRSWLEGFPNGRLIVVEDAGHEVPTERPTAVVEAVQDMIGQLENDKLQ